MLDSLSCVALLSLSPLWVFQGHTDRHLPVVREMRKQLEKAHHNLRYAENHHVDHDIRDRSAPLALLRKARSAGHIHSGPTWQWHTFRESLE